MSAKDPQPTSRIYALEHPETGLKRFVECTHYLLPEKLYRIKSVAKYGGTCLRSRWVRQLASRGLEPRIVLLQENAGKEGLPRWKREYANELLDTATRERPRHDRSKSEGTG